MQILNRRGQQERFTAAPEVPSSSFAALPSSSQRDPSETLD
jgi:hypothetical protein